MNHRSFFSFYIIYQNQLLYIESFVPLNSASTKFTFDQTHLPQNSPSAKFTLDKTHLRLNSPSALLNIGPDPLIHMKSDGMGWSNPLSMS